MAPPSLQYTQIHYTNSICAICYNIFKTNNSTDQRLTQPGRCIIPWGSDGASTVSSRAPKFPQHGLLLRYNVLRNTPTSPNVSAAELWKSNSQYWMLWEIGVSCFDDWTQFRLSTDLNLFNQKGEAHDSINQDPLKSFFGGNPFCWKTVCQNV